MSEPPHHNPIEVISFIGTSTRVVTEAIEGARKGLRAWYAQQDILFYAHGGSVFNYSTSSYVDDGEYTFIITVVDARPK